MQACDNFKHTSMQAIVTTTSIQARKHVITLRMQACDNYWHTSIQAGDNYKHYYYLLFLLFIIIIITIIIIIILKHA